MNSKQMSVCCMLTGVIFCVLGFIWIFFLNNAWGIFYCFCGAGCLFMGLTWPMTQHDWEMSLISKDRAFVLITLAVIWCIVEFIWIFRGL